MALLRLALVSCLLLAAANVGLAQKEKSKIDKAKLVGTWTYVKSSEKDGTLPAGIVLKVEFAKDGKLNVSFTVKDKEQKQSGTYTLKGDQLTTVTKRGDKERKETATITELTDKKLVISAKKGDKTETREFKK